MKVKIDGYREKCDDCGQEFTALTDKQAKSMLASHTQRHQLRPNILKGLKTVAQELHNFGKTVMKE